MTRKERTQRGRVIQIVVAVVALMLVLIFAPRMEGPRVLFSISFTTKTGTPGLTNLGWGLLILAPVLAYMASGLVLRLTHRKDDPSVGPR